MNELFLSKERRDKRAKELQAAGHTVLRRRITNQLLHPQYVRDYVGEYQTGFGNTDYKTFFGVLYAVQVLS